MTKLILVIWQVFLSLTEGDKLVFVKLFIRSLLWYGYQCSCCISYKIQWDSLLVCVLFTPVHFSSSRTQYRRGERGRRIQREAAWGEDPEEESLSLLELISEILIKALLKSKWLYSVFISSLCLGLLINQLFTLTATFVAWLCWVM